MKNMKKLIMIFISIVMFIGTYSVYAETSDNNLIQDGTYIQIGKYNEDPILWRCISTNEDDENGKLIISDRILCYKCFDSRRAGDRSQGHWIRFLGRIKLESMAEFLKKQEKIYYGRGITLQI